MRRLKFSLFVLAIAALIGCLDMIAGTRTANANWMEMSVIILSTLAGWVIIYCWIFVLNRTRRELSHARMLRSEEREEITGKITVTDEHFTIRKSVPVRGVEVLTKGGTPAHLLICETRADALRILTHATLYSCHGYVAAYKVLSND